MTAWLRVAARDLRAEARSRDQLATSLALALVLVVVGDLAFHDVGVPEAAASGTLWTAIALTAALAIARGLEAERDRGSLEGLLLLPLDRGSLFLGKVASALVVVLLVAVASLLGLALLFGIPPTSAWGGLLVLVVLGSVGLVLGSTLAGALALHARARTVLAPVLLAPLVVPLLIPGVHGVAAALAGAPWGSIVDEATFMVGYDLALGGVSWWLFEQAVEA